MSNELKRCLEDTHRVLEDMMIERGIAPLWVVMYRNIDLPDDSGAIVLRVDDITEAKEEARTRLISSAAQLFGPGRYDGPVDYDVAVVRLVERSYGWLKPSWNANPAGSPIRSSDASASWSGTIVVDNETAEISE